MSLLGARRRSSRARVAGEREPASPFADRVDSAGALCASRALAVPPATRARRGCGGSGRTPRRGRRRDPRRARARRTRPRSRWCARTPPPAHQRHRHARSTADRRRHAPRSSIPSRPRTPTPGTRPRAARRPGTRHRPGAARPRPGGQRLAPTTHQHRRSSQRPGAQPPSSSPCGAHHRAPPARSVKRARDAGAVDRFTRAGKRFAAARAAGRQP